MEMFIFRGLLRETGEQIEYFQFPERTLDSPLDKPSILFTHFFNAARFLCVLKCFSKYTELMFKNTLL